MKHNNSEWICCVGAQSGGNIIPALELARQECLQTTAAQEDGSPSKVLFFSGNSILDKTIVGNHPQVTKQVMLPLLKISWRAWYRAPIMAFLFMYGCVRSFVALYRHRPRKIISIGGATALPVCLSGWLLGIPIVVYELNAVAGRSVKLISRLARTTYFCFDSAGATLARRRGKKNMYPLRYTSLSLAKEAARKDVGIDMHARVLLVVGGSHGSVYINELIKQFIMSARYQLLSEFTPLVVIHQTGDEMYDEMKRFYRQNSIDARVFSFAEDLAVYYAAADVALARAGAGTLFELVYFRVRSILIPLEARANDHQLENAFSMAKEYPSLFTVFRQESVKEQPDKFNAYLEYALAPTHEGIDKNSVQSLAEEIKRKDH